MDFNRPKLTKSILQVRKQHRLYRPSVKTYPKKAEVSSSSSLEDLLVFGYASKLYPPDQHSKKIAKSEHLILWNDDRDVNLTIDRYDCRASLHDLSDFQTNSWNVTHQISEEENRIEDHLNDERYWSLFNNEEETKTAQEEEIKRLNAYLDKDKQYGEVEFKYNENQNKVSTENNNDNETNKKENDVFNEKPFTAPKLLAIPAEMEIPPTEKMHAIIQKTAVFVSKQGTQMEIVLKTKQSNNSQFQFLDYGHYLNPYYRHMISRIKEGKYTPGLEVKNESLSEDSEESSDGDGEYLHPSLFATSHNTRKTDHEEKTKVIRKVDPDHPLAKLIEKGKADNAVELNQNMTNNSYGYYNNQQNINQYGEKNENFTSSAATQDIPQSSGTYSSSSISYSNTQGYDGQRTWHEQHYIVPPSPDLQPIVENMARQAATEGDAVEKTVIEQNNPVYAFLTPYHELYPYYQYRKQAWYHSLYSASQSTVNIAKPPVAYNVEPEKVEQPPNNNNNITQEPTAESLTKQSPALPISFLIKSFKEGIKKTTLPASTFLEDQNSDDEKIVEKNNSDQPSIATTTSNSTTETSFTSTPVLLTTPSPIFSPSNISTFSAVTPSGQSASILNLREKQAERRQRALLFLKAKHNTVVTQSQETKSEENREMLASEDIFDLSDNITKDKRADPNGQALSTLSTNFSSSTTNDFEEKKENENMVPTLHAHSPSLSPKSKRKRSSVSPKRHKDSYKDKSHKKSKKKKKHKSEYIYDNESDGDS